METTQQKIEEIIKKAIEGGYGKETESHPEFIIWEGVREWFGGSNSAMRNLSLDPLFFQALGKACGWDRECYICKAKESTGEHELVCSKAGWNDKVDKYGIINTALRFHEINLETQDFWKAIDYLFNLITK